MTDGSVGEPTTTRRTLVAVLCFGLLRQQEMTSLAAAACSSIVKVDPDKVMLKTIVNKSS